jgi:hypothetical protein
MGKKFALPVVMGDESLMAPKAHGTSAVYVPKRVDTMASLAFDQIICFIAACPVQPSLMKTSTLPPSFSHTSFFE